MRIFFFFTLFLGLLQAENLIEYDYEADLYYSNVSAFIDLDKDANITDGTNLSEYQIYNDLLSRSLSPNIFLLEAAFHPMAWGGMWYRKHHPQKYEKATIEDFNLIKVLTAGWEEPYSLSFFVGRMMVFKRKNASHIGKNRAYTGFLLSIGNKSIKDNLSFRDHWSNFELKLKGTRELEEKDLDWSFRVGFRHHTNKDFVDTLYVGARRTSVDFNKPKLSLIYNSGFETLLEVSKENFKITKGEIILEKKWPSRFFTKITYGLGIGYHYYGGNRYKGALRDEGVDNHQLILRPNIKW